MSKSRLSWEEQKKRYEQRNCHYWKDMEVDQEFEPFIFPITDELVEEIMEVTGDRNHIYTDKEVAKKASFPGRIAPQASAMIFGRLSYLGETHRPVPGGMALGISFWFFKPVQIGDTITSRAKVIAREERKGKKFFTIRAESTNQNDEMVSIMEQSGILPL